MGGITNGGWKLVYDDQPSEFTKAMEKDRNFVDARFSVGLALDDKGRIQDVIAGESGMEGGNFAGNDIGRGQRTQI